MIFLGKGCKMSEVNIKNEYQKLLKTKNIRLPNFNEIDLDFEISTIDTKRFLLREIRRRILDKFDGIKEILESIIQPDVNSFQSMYESRIFSDEERNDIYLIYKNLMIFIRKANIVSLRADEKEEADFINEVFAEWKILKPKLIKYLSKIKENWGKETSVKEDLGYLG